MAVLGGAHVLYWYGFGGFVFGVGFLETFVRYSVDAEVRAARDVGLVCSAVDHFWNLQFAAGPGADSGFAGAPVMANKPIRMWRVKVAEDLQGMYVWFDPNEEAVSLRDLTDHEKAVILDMHGSVSALGEGEEVCELDGCDPLKAVLPQLFLFGGNDG